MVPASYGYRDRILDTRLGSLQLRVPKLRQGSYFPLFVEPRKTTEKALVAVIQEACANPSGFAGIGGVSTRKMDNPVQTMGLSGISKGTVSKLGASTTEWMPFSTAGSAPYGPARAG